MNRAGKRQSLAQQSRRNKALYLPMSSATADSLVLPVRIALESIRSGYMTREAVVTLSGVARLTGFLTAEGHGVLQRGLLDAAERRLLDALNDVEATSAPEPDLIEALTMIVNEYDRLMRECRLLAIVRANEHCERISQSANRKSELPIRSTARAS